MNLDGKKKEDAAWFGKTAKDQKSYRQADRRQQGIEIFEGL